MATHSGAIGHCWWTVCAVLTLLIFVQSATAQSPIRGVNLGGWLLVEEWITPSLFTSPSAVDEWTLCDGLGKKSCASLLQSHWSSFFTRSDFEDIKSAGLNAVRIPIGYWAVDLTDEEPYVNGQYPFLIRAVTWAQQLGLSVLIDVHGAPGSQNGQDNSGRIGSVLFPSNATNSDRTLAVLQNLTSEFSQSEYGGVVTGIELLNEPRITTATFPMTTLQSFYSVGYESIRALDQGVGVVAHDAFYGPQYWSTFNLTADLTIDSHQYYAFAPLQNLPHDTILESICNVSQLLKSSSTPVNIVGEWSLETGHAPNSSSSAQNREDNQVKRTWLRLLFEAQLAAYSPGNTSQPSHGWYFWTWKTEYDIDTWSYRRGLDQGYIPSDVSNSSTLAFPLLANGCIDSSYNYTAPRTPGSATVLAEYSVIWILLVTSIAVAVTLSLS